MSRIKSILKFLWKALLPVALIGLLIFSIRVTQPDLGKLVASAPKARDILSQLLSPQLISRESDKITVSQVLPVPCGSVPNPEIPTTGA
ncbi:MAG TPA: hypothetical protein DDW19_00025, partial [Anaerolineaceae bacterium]|nr:hypothetical protein [Anaerolineaceae bacterium]